MSNAESQIAAVARFSDRYHNEYLEQSKEDLCSEEDPFQLRFFLKRAFASARNEEVSARYRKNTEVVIREYRSQIESKWSKSNDAISDEELNTVLERKGVTNQFDRRMVIEIIEYLGEIPEQDIISYTKDIVEDGRIDELFEELTSIFNIGPKKTTLYLRDVVSHFELEDSLKTEPEDNQYRYIFPVDTWVFQFGKKIGIVDTDSPNWKTNSTKMVKKCGSVSPLSFNQGAWYLGANSFDVLVENLEHLNPNVNSE